MLMPWYEMRMSTQKNMAESLRKRVKKDKEEIHIDLDLILEYKIYEIRLLVFPAHPCIFPQCVECGLWHVVGAQ